MTEHEHAHGEHHVVPVPIYVGIFVALLVLTGVTVWVAFLDLGEWGFLHTPIALAIASFKAALVVLWFMHVKYSVKLTWIFIAAGILWLVLLMGITLADYAGRNWELQDPGWRATEVVRESPADLA